MIAKVRNGLLLVLLLVVTAYVVVEFIAPWIPMLLVALLLVLGLGAIIRKLF